MQTINTVAFESAAGLAKAGEGLRQTFRDTGQSMADLQGAEYDLVSAGVKLSDAQTGVNTAVHLSVGALGTTAEAVDVLTTAINSYNLKAKDGSIATATWTRISDELAQAVADGKVKLSDIASTYATVAPVAAQAGVKTGEIAAALGYLTAKGNPAAETLTQMNRAIVELSKPKGDMEKVLKALGQSGTDLISQHGLAGALGIIRDQAAKMKIPFIDLFGRIEAYKFALQTTGPNAAGFQQELDRIANSAGMTNRQFDERAQGFNYQLGILKANVQDAGITIGTALLPPLTELAKEASDFLRGHQQDIADFGKSLAGGFRDAVAWSRRMDWGSILSALKAAAGFGKSLADGFMAMPTDAKAILLGLFGANKLTGGAVVKVAVDLAGGLASGIANALGSGLLKAGIGKAFVQPVFVTNPGFGGPGGPNSPSSQQGGPSFLSVLGWGALAAQVGNAVIHGLGDVGKAAGDAIGGKFGRGVGAGSQASAQASSAFFFPGLDALNDILSGKNPLDRKPMWQQLQDANGGVLRERKLGIGGGSSGGGTWGPAATDAIVKPLDQLHKDFLAQMGILKKTADPHAAAVAAAKAAEGVTKGVGSLSTTRDLLATLQRDRRLVASSGDRADLAKIDAAIRAVQGKIPGREWVAQQLAEAKRIAASSESSDKKQADLKRIQSSLLSHSDTAAARTVAKLSQIAAKKTDVNVTVPVTINQTITSRDIYVAQLVRARGVHQAGQSAYP